ncbi:MAG TPA: hypothetical protein VHR39_03865 [Propionibacteriaceae bacterium]|nr:hypothetical protein [Propionibacteriaceae bacterium]
MHSKPIVGTPKPAGVRASAIPPHILPTVRQHLADHVASQDRDSEIARSLSAMVEAEPV